MEIQMITYLLEYHIAIIFVWHCINKWYIDSKMFKAHGSNGSCRNVIHIRCFHSNWPPLFRLNALIQSVMYPVPITRKLFLWVVAKLNGQFSWDQLRVWFCLFMVYLTTVAVLYHYKKVKKSRYRPGVAQMVPGS